MVFDAVSHNCYTYILIYVYFEVCIYSISVVLPFTVKYFRAFVEHLKKANREREQLTLTLLQY